MSLKSNLLTDPGWQRTLAPDDSINTPITNIYLVDYRFSLDGVFTLVRQPESILELKTPKASQVAASSKGFLDLLQEAALGELEKQKKNELFMFLAAFIQGNDVYLSWLDAKNNEHDPSFKRHILLNIHDGSQGVMIFPQLFVTQQEIEPPHDVAVYSKRLMEVCQQAYPTLFLSCGQVM